MKTLEYAYYAYTFKGRLKKFFHAKEESNGVHFDRRTVHYRRGESRPVLIIIQVFYRQDLAFISALLRNLSFIIK